MTYYTPFKDAQEAEAAFVAFVDALGGVHCELAMNAHGNAFAVEVHIEISDWIEALTDCLDPPA